MKDWSNITIEEYQLIYGIMVDKSLTEEDRIFKLVCIVNNLEEDYVNNLPISKYKELKATINFLYDGKRSAKTNEYITVGGKEYLINFDVSKYHLGRYTDLTIFVSEEHALVVNLHKIMASLCTEVKTNFWGKKKPVGKYGENYNELCEQFLKMNFADCYNTALFFWKIIRDLTKTTSLYLAKEIMKTGKITKKQVREIFNLLKVDGDGFIMPSY